MLHSLTSSFHVLSVLTCNNPSLPRFISVYPSLCLPSPSSIASRVLLATLCVPIEPTPSDVDRFLEVDQNDREKARRLAALLRVTSLPSRASLLRDVVSLTLSQPGSILCDRDGERRWNL